jgi:hypothetical protein
MSNALMRYTLAMTATIGLVSWVLTLAFTTEGALSAIMVSAVVAAVIQVAAFAMTRSMITENVIAAWGAGALVRMLALFAYAVLAVKVLGLTPVPALISIAVFFFLSTLLEPVFLRR